MKRQSVGGGFLIGVFLSALLAWGTSAQQAHDGPIAPAASTTPEIRQDDSTNTNAAPAKPDDGKAGRDLGIKARHSAGVDEVLQMMHADVSTEVIKTYIENSPIPYSLTANEIVALKDQAVPDDLTTAMLKRGATLRAQVTQSSTASAVVLAYSGGNRLYGGLDPESYDYFQYYYLYPRTLAAANQRLFTPYPSSSRLAPYPYGLCGPMPFRALPPSVFRHP
jgi:hypothetical protein